MCRIEMSGRTLLPLAPPRDCEIVLGADVAENEEHGPYSCIFSNTRSRR